MRTLGSRALATLAALGLTGMMSGCGWFSQTRGQHAGTTVLLVGLSAQERAARGASTLGCARSTVTWAAKQGSTLIMAPIGLPGAEHWQTVNFALHTSAQRTNPFAARRWRERQSAIAERDLAALQPPNSEQASLDVLAAATDGSRVLNYQHGPRTLVLCTAAQQHSPELTLGRALLSEQAIYATLYRLRAELEPMRLTRVVFGAAGDAAQTGQSLTEQAGVEAFWRTWAHHESAIHFSYGPIPHYPY
jgi:hypothetical protein